MTTSTSSTSFLWLRMLRISSTLLLVALLGLPATLFAADSNVRIVQVSYVGGEVLVTQGSSTQPVKVKNYLPLAHGALLVTEDGVVEIEFEDELLARLAESSRLDLSELVLREDGSRLTRLTLREGTATFSARLKKYDTFQIVTPYFSVTVLKNAKVRIDLTGQGGRVKVLDGKVEVETPDDVLELKAGRQLEWDVESAQVALGPASEDDGWDEWNDDRDQAVQNARRARRWGVQVASSPYYSDYHYGHSHRYGYCPYYNPYYSHGSLLSIHFGGHHSYFSFWGIGFGYHSYGHYYPGYYSGYYPVFAGGYWPYSYGARRHHRHYSRRTDRRAHRRDRHDGRRGTVARNGGGSTIGNDSDRVGTRRSRRGEGDRVRDRFRREGARAGNSGRLRSAYPERTNRREDILRRLAERNRTPVAPRTRVTERQRPSDTGQNGDRRRETLRRVAERGTARRTSSGSRGTTSTRRVPEASPAKTRESGATARRSSPRREAPRQATRGSQPERSAARTRPTTRRERPSARTRSRSSSRPASSASRRSPSTTSSASRPRPSSRSASAGRSRSSSRSSRASRPSRSSSSRSSRSVSSGGSAKASRGKRNR